MTHALRKELKQTKAFSRPEVAVYVGLQLTSDALRAPVARLFKDHSLSEPQYNVLRILRGASEPLPSLEVASRMVTRLPDITRLVDRLVDAHLARRKRCTEDRRVVHLTITKAGLALLEELDAPLEALHRELLGHLTRKQLSQLGTLLDRARETVSRSHD